MLCAWCWYASFGCDRRRAQGCHPRARVSVVRVRCLRAIVLANRANWLWGGWWDGQREATWDGGWQEARVAVGCAEGHGAGRDVCVRASRTCVRTRAEGARAWSCGWVVGRVASEAAWPVCWLKAVEGEGLGGRGVGEVEGGCSAGVVWLLRACRTCVRARSVSMWPYLF